MQQRRAQVLFKGLSNDSNSGYCSHLEANSIVFANTQIVWKYIDILC